MRQVNLDSTKQTYVDAFFQYHRRRAERLLELWGQGHQDDALTLCCCYLDGLASFAYYCSHRSAYNFVALLREHGAEPELSLCSPLALIRWMEGQGGWRKVASGKLRVALGTTITTLISDKNLEGLLKAHLPHRDFQRLTSDIWRASVAYIAYERLRNPFVHQLGGPGAVIVTSATVTDKEVAIDFPVLHQALLRALDHFESVSRKTGRWLVMISSHDHGRCLRCA